MKGRNFLGGFKIGEVIGDRTIISDEIITKTGGKYQETRCKCNRTQLTQISALKQGRLKRCQQCQNQLVRQQSFDRVKGRAFSQLTVIGESPTENHGSVKALTRCSCGRDHVAVVGRLLSGRTKRCTVCATVRHPKYNKHHPLYDIWKGIKSRIFRERDANFARYGGRGLTMDAEWAESFPAFAQWIDENLGERPDNHSIDRIDNDYGYHPYQEDGATLQLRWADTKTQANNRCKLEKYSKTKHGWFTLHTPKGEFITEGSLCYCCKAMGLFDAAVRQLSKPSKWGRPSMNLEQGLNYMLKKKYQDEAPIAIWTSREQRQSSVG